MATKKPTAISKHKATTARKTVKPAQPQAFDIIPKSKVRPSTTSRPVITGSTPVVADNTLTTSSGAPTLQVKRRNIVINPSDDTDLSKEDVMPNVAATAVSSENNTEEAVVETTVTPATQGVAVSDLIAKRAVGEKVLSPPASTSVAESELVPAPPSPTVEPATDANPGTTPELPVSQPEHVDDQAAAEAARLLSDEPVASPVNAAPSVEAPEAELSPPEEAVADASVAVEPEAVKPAETDEAVPIAEPQATAKTDENTDAAAPASAQGGDESVPNNTLKEVLKEDPVEPQKHSQALKDAMKGMDGKPQHHELYGGKPVIVVHKEHGAMSAMAWVLWFFLCLGLAILIVNFLLDAGFIETTYRIPHTNIL